MKTLGFPKGLTGSLLIVASLSPIFATKQVSAVIPRYVALPRYFADGSPQSNASPSGRFVLYMVPHDWMGRSGASYRFEQDGKQQWSDERNYTLKYIVVTDFGFVVGVAYRGIPVEAGGKRWGWIQIFHVVILNDVGSEILNDEEVRHSNRVFLSNPPRPQAPYAEQLLVDPDNDRIVLRVLEPAGSAIRSDNDPCALFPCSDWRAYQLSTGKRVFSFNPKARLSKDHSANKAAIASAQLIRNTPLILTHSYTVVRSFEPQETQFELLDSLGQAVWSLKVGKDYTGIDWPNPRMGRSGPGRFFQENPAILSTDLPNRFDLRFFATNERVTFEVVRAEGDSWLVSELERKPFIDSP